MTLPQARLLIESSFPELEGKLSHVLIVLNYYTRRNYQAYLEPVPEEKSLAELGWDRPELDLKPSQMGVATQKMPL